MLYSARLWVCVHCIYNKKANCSIKPSKNCFYITNYLISGILIYTCHSYSSSSLDSGELWQVFFIFSKRLGLHMLPPGPHRHLLDKTTFTRHSSTSHWKFIRHDGCLCHSLKENYSGIPISWTLDFSKTR